MNTGFVVCNKFVSEFTVSGAAWNTNTVNAAKAAFATLSTVASYHTAPVYTGATDAGIFSHRLRPADTKAQLSDLSRAAQVTLTGISLATTPSPATEEYIRVVAPTWPGTVTNEKSRVIGATVTVGTQTLRVVAYDSTDLVLQRASNWAALQNSDFASGMTLSLLGLQPQAGVSNGDAIRTESFYGIPTAQVLDARGTGYSADHSVELVSTVQEDHVQSPEITLSAQLPAEFRHNAADATRNTTHSVIFENPGSVAYDAAQEQVVITDDKNRFPLIAGTNDSLSTESALELRHSTNASLHVDGTVKSVAITDGGSGYADGTYVLDGGDRNAHISVTTQDNVATASVSNPAATGKAVAANADDGYQVGDVLSVQTGSSADSSLLTLRVDTVKNRIAANNVTLADANIRGRYINGTGEADPEETRTLNLAHGTATYNVADTTNLAAGMAVSGKHIQMGTTIASLVANTSITLSKPPLGTENGIQLTFQSADWDDLVATKDTQFELNGTSHVITVLNVKTSATGIASLATGDITASVASVATDGVGVNTATRGTFERTLGSGYNPNDVLSKNGVEVTIDTVKREVETAKMVADESTTGSVHNLNSAPPSQGSGHGYTKDAHLVLTGGALVRVDSTINELGTIDTTNLLDSGANKYTDGVVGSRGSGYTLASGVRELTLLTGDAEAKCPKLEITDLKSIVEKNSLQIVEEGSGYTALHNTTINLNGSDATGGTADITVKDVLEEALITEGGQAYAVGETVTVGADATVTIRATESRLKAVAIGATPEAGTMPGRRSPSVPTPKSSFPK